MKTNNSWATYVPTTIHETVFARDSDKQRMLDLVSGDLPFPMGGVNGILLYGVTGTGKSTLAKLLPDAIENHKTGTRPMMEHFEIENESDGRAALRLVRRQSDFHPLSGSHHYYVIDEVDLIGKENLDGLKALMQKPTTIFIFTTNALNKIPVPLQNRCNCFEFNKAPDSHWLPAVKTMLSLAGVVCGNDQALLAVIASCNGSGRDIKSAVATMILNWKRRNMSTPTSII